MANERTGGTPGGQHAEALPVDPGADDPKRTAVLSALVEQLTRRELEVPVYGVHAATAAVMLAAATFLLV